jgi:hypothetical protein
LKDAALLPETIEPFRLKSVLSSEEIQKMRNVWKGMEAETVSYPEFLLELTYHPSLPIQTLAVSALTNFIDRSPVIRERLREFSGVKIQDKMVSHDDPVEYMEVANALRAVPIGIFDLATRGIENVVEFKVDGKSFTKQIEYFPLQQRFSGTVWKEGESGKNIPIALAPNENIHMDYQGTKWVLYDFDAYTIRKFLMRSIDAGQKRRIHTREDYAAYLKYKLLDLSPPEHFLRELRSHFEMLAGSESVPDEVRAKIRQALDQDSELDFFKEESGTAEEASLAVGVDLGVLGQPVEKIWAFKALAMLQPLNDEAKTKLKELLPTRSTFTDLEKQAVLHRDWRPYRSRGEITVENTSGSRISIPEGTLRQKMEVLIDTLVLVYGKSDAKAILEGWAEDLTDSWLMDFYIERMIRRSPF